MENIDYEAFERENILLQAELKSVLERMENLSLKYGMTVHLDGPAYGMGGWFEPIRDTDEEEEQYINDRGEVNKDNTGYWMASSASC